MEHPPVVSSRFGAPGDQSTFAGDALINSRILGYTLRHTIRAKHAVKGDSFFGKGKVLEMSIQDWHDGDAIEAPHYVIRMRNRFKDGREKPYREYSATVRYLDYQSMPATQEIKNNPGVYQISVIVKRGPWVVFDKLWAHFLIHRIAKVYERAMKDAYPDYYIQTSPPRFGVPVDRYIYH